MRKRSWILGMTLVGAMSVTAPALAASTPTSSLSSLEAQHPAMSQKLSFSSQGHWVMTLQADLNLLGDPSGPVDGVFGPLTEKGVRHFQSTHHLAVTGVTTPATWQAILAGLHLVPAAPATQHALVATKTKTKSSAKTIDGRPILHVYHMMATAYGPSLQDNYPYGATDAFGKPLRAGMVAVDPRVIPLKSTVYVTGYHDGALPQGGFVGQAMDTGGAIKGARIDIFLNAGSTVVSNFGVEPVTVDVLGQ